MEQRKHDDPNWCVLHFLVPPFGDAGGDLRYRYVDAGGTRWRCRYADAYCYGDSDTDSDTNTNRRHPYTDSNTDARTVRPGRVPRTVSSVRHLPGWLWL